MNVLSSYPNLRGDSMYSDSEALTDLMEWAEAAKAALERVASALDGSLVDDVDDLDLVEGEELDFAGRVVSLTKRCDAEAARLSSRAVGAENLNSRLFDEMVALKASLGDLAKDREFLAGRNRELETERDAALKDAAFFKTSADEAAHNVRVAEAEVRELKDQRDQALEIGRRDAARLVGCERHLAGALLEAEKTDATLSEVRRELADADARIEALEVDVDLLTSHIDRIDDSYSRDDDCWEGWDLTP